MKDTGGSAFPVPHPQHASGMTLRDYFAAKAMAEMIDDLDDYNDIIARRAYRLADAMIAERAKV